MSTKGPDFAELEEALGHRFADKDLLKRALTHASIGRASSNERLEFLGDRVLGLIVAERLYKRFPAQDEGGLTMRLHAQVRHEACARAAQAAGLDKHLILARSHNIRDGARNPALLADAFEAIIAALFIDGGYEAAWQFVMRYWKEATGETVATPVTEGATPASPAKKKAGAKQLKDAKTALQEWAQGPKGPRAMPAYRLTKRDGTDHAPSFTVEVRVGKLDPETGTGSSKRAAEQDAARRMLEKLGKWSAE